VLLVSIESNAGFAAAVGFGSQQATSCSKRPSDGPQKSAHLAEVLVGFKTYSRFTVCPGSMAMLGSVANSWSADVLVEFRRMV